MQYPRKLKFTARPCQAAVLALFAALPALSQASCPTTPLSGAWTALGSFNTSNGMPNGMTNSTALIPSDIVTRVNRLLGAEGRNIANNPETQALLTDDLGGNLFLTKNANIKVVFLNEGAGYTNSIGFFKFTKAGLPRPAITGERIIFSNASSPPLSSGHTVDLGNFLAGEAVGFTVVSNGWSSPSVRSRPATAIFRTVRALNPEVPPRNAHTVLLSNPENRLLVLAMEDLNRENRACNDHGHQTDDDFNDIILAILVEPFDAVDTGTIPDVDTGTTSGTPENPDEPLSSGGNTPLIGTGDDPTYSSGTPPTHTGGGSRAIGVSGRQTWHESTESRQ